MKVSDASKSANRSFESLRTDCIIPIEPHEINQYGGIPKQANYIAPDGTEIRLLTESTAMNMAHGYTLPGTAMNMAHGYMLPGKTSTPGSHKSVTENWFILHGEGMLRIKKPNGQQSDLSLEKGVHFQILPGDHFQFHVAAVEPLEFLICDTPPWPGADEWYPVDPLFESYKKENV